MSQPTDPTQPIRPSAVIRREMLASLRGCSGPVITALADTHSEHWTRDGFVAEWDKTIGELVAAVRRETRADGDAKDTEIQRLTAERDAADEALHGQPVLRHCVLPGCLREYDAAGGLSGKPVRESWSSKGWLMIPSLHSHICPEHTALVADDAHRPNWDRAAKPTILMCACGWQSPGVRWTGFATAAWRDHLLTVTEEV